MAYSIGISDNVGHHDPCAGRHGKERETFDPGSLDDRFEVINQLLEAEVDVIPIGQPDSPKIIADERMSSCERRNPWLPDRTVPIKLQVMDEMGHEDERRPRATDRVGDPRPVAAGTETYVLCLEIHGC